MIGAELVERALRPTGTRTVFGLAGAQHFRLLEVLEREGYRIVGNRGESGSIGAADGYARTTRRPGVALVIANQGIVNGVSALATAYEAGSPVVVLMARPPLWHDEPVDARFVNETLVLDPVCKWSATVHGIERLGEYVQVACNMASAARPGPVLLSIPSDLLSAEVPPETEALVAGAVTPLVAVPPAGPVAVAPPAPAETARIAELVSVAERPLLIAGEGLRWGAAGEALRALSEKFRLPVLAEGLGRGLLDEDLRLVYPWPLALVAAGQADVVVFLGCRLDRRFGSGSPPWFASDATLVGLAADTGELAASPRLSLSVAGDLAQALAAVASGLAARRYPGSDPDWVRAALEARLARVAEVGHDEMPVHPYRIARELEAALAGEMIFVGDGADVLNFMRGVLTLRRGGLWLDQRPLGSMGIGTPLALGAAAGEDELAAEEGRPPRPVVLVTGDGAFGYHLAELETMSRCGLAVTILVSNDGAWGTERHGQMRVIGRAINTDLAQARYDVTAEGLGCRGVLVEHASAIGPALASALAAGAATVVNVLTDRDAGRLRKEDPLLETVFHDDLMIRRAQSLLAPVRSGQS